MQFVHNCKKKITPEKERERERFKLTKEEFEGGRFTGEGQAIAEEPILVLFFSDMEWMKEFQRNRKRGFFLQASEASPGLGRWRSGPPVIRSYHLVGSTWAAK